MGGAILAAILATGLASAETKEAPLTGVSR